MLGYLLRHFGQKRPRQRVSRQKSTARPHQRLGWVKKRPVQALGAALGATDLAGPHYEDTVCYHYEAFACCYHVLGAEHLLFGTDHPFGAYQVPAELLDRLDPS